MSQINHIRPSPETGSRGQVFRAKQDCESEESALVKPPWASWNETNNFNHGWFYAAKHTDVRERLIAVSWRNYEQAKLFVIIWIA